MRRINRIRTRPVTGAKRLANRFVPTSIITEDDTFITESNKLITKQSKNNVNNSVHS